MTRNLQLVLLLILFSISKSWAMVGDSCSHPIVANLCGNGSFTANTDSFTNNDFNSWSFGNQYIFNYGQAIYYQINLPVSSYQPVSLSASLAGYIPNCYSNCGNTLNFLWFDGSPCSSNPVAVSTYNISGTSTFQDSIFTSFTISNVQSQYYLVILPGSNNYSYGGSYQFNLQLGFTNNQPLPSPICSPAPPPYKGQLELDQSKCYTSSNPYPLSLSVLNDNPNDSNVLYPTSLNQGLTYLPIGDDNGNGYILTIKTEDNQVNYSEIYKSFDQFPYSYSPSTGSLNYLYDIAITVFLKNNGGAQGLKGFRIQVPGSSYTYYTNEHPQGTGIYDPSGNWVVHYDPNSETYTWLFTGANGRGDNINNNGYSCQVYTFDCELNNLGNTINAWYLPDNYGNDSMQCTYGASNPTRTDCGLLGDNYEQGWIQIGGSGGGGGGMSGQTCGSDYVFNEGVSLYPCNNAFSYSDITYDANGCAIETDYDYDMEFADFWLNGTLLNEGICRGKPYQLSLEGNGFYFPENPPATLVFQDSAGIYHPVDSLGHILYSENYDTLTLPSGLPVYPQNPNNNSFTIPLSVAGNYSIMYTYYDPSSNAYFTSCNSGSITVNVDSNPKIIFRPASDATICKGNSISITALNNQDDYNLWQPDSTLNSNYYSSVTAHPMESITYTVTGLDYKGCLDTGTFILNVKTCPPIADFDFGTYDCSYICTIFYDASLNSPSQWLWSFPGGKPSFYMGKTPPAICYDSAGIYPVKLVVSNTAGNDSIIKNIRIGSCKALASFLVNDSSICKSKCLTFINTSTFDSLTYPSFSWNFPGGNPSTYYSYRLSDQPTICYADTGTYIAQLMVNTYYAIDTFGLTIHLTNCPPVARFTSNDTLCNSKCAIFTNISTGNLISWQWNFTGGSPSSYSGVNPPAVCYTTPGNYTVSLIVGDSTTSDTSIHTITITGCPPVAKFIMPDTVCATQCIGISDSSSPNTTSWQWSFPGGSPSSYNGNTPPAVCYSQPGNDTVTLIVSNSYGSDTLNKIIGVKNCFPRASFAAVDSICRNGCITVTDSSSANSTSWQWLFNGGIPGNFTGPTPPMVCYDTAGTYSIRLIATNSISSDTLVKTITVNACNPTAGFTVNNDTICRTNCVTLTNTSSANATAWQWNFAGGTPSSYTGQNPPNVCYGAAGSYTIQLIAGNASASDTVSKTIVVNSCTPTAGFTANKTTCITTCLTITNTSVNATQWSWSFPGGTPSSHIGSTVPNICYSTAGTYSITLIVSNVYGNDTVTSQVVANDCSLPKASFSEKDTICATDCVAIMVDSINNVSTWNWSFPGGNPSSFSGQNPPAVCYGVVGKYTSQLIVANNYGADTVYRALVVNSCTPRAAFAGLDSICPGDCITFINTSSANATNWQWVFNGGTPPGYSGENPTAVCFPALGKYAIQLVASNSYGSDTATQNITVYKDNAGNIITSIDTICEGNPALLNLENNSGTLQWQVSDTTTHFTNISGATSGSYQFSSINQNTYVRVIAGSGNCADTSGILKLSVEPPVTGTFTWSISGDTVSFNSHDSSGAVFTYSWNFGDSDTTSLLANPVHVYGKTDTTFNVCLTVYDGSNCSYTFCKQVAVGLSGVASVSAQTGILVYPNPAQDELTVEVLDNFIPKQIAMVDALGRTVLQVTPNKSNSVLDIHTYAAGIYFVKIQLEDGSVAVRKFVKE